MKHLRDVTKCAQAQTLDDYANKGYCKGFALAEPKRQGGPEVPDECEAYLK